MTSEERRALIERYKGVTVRIEIDRPIGYVHKKGEKTLTYPVNYGYIPGVIGGDGEELDVFLLGVDMPVREYTGRIIGAVYRRDDDEDKLIMSSGTKEFTLDEVRRLLYFSEKYYDSDIVLF